MLYFWWSFSFWSWGRYASHLLCSLLGASGNAMRCGNIRSIGTSERLGCDVHGPMSSFGVVLVVYHSFVVAHFLSCMWLGMRNVFCPAQMFFDRSFGMFVVLITSFGGFHLFVCCSWLIRNARPGRTKDRRVKVSALYASLHYLFLLLRIPSRSY